MPSLTASVPSVSSLKSWVSKPPEHLRGLLQIQRLSAHIRTHLRLLQRLLDCTRVIACSQVVEQSLALLRKDQLEELDERLFFNLQRRYLWRNHHAQYRGMHFWR